MPVVDFEAAWYALKAHIASEALTRGCRVAETMASIEVANRIPEMHQGYDDRPEGRYPALLTTTPLDRPRDRDGTHSRSERTRWNQRRTRDPAGIATAEDEGIGSRLT